MKCKYTALCWNAAYDDLATHGSMRRLVVPAMRKEVAELRRIRNEAKRAGCLDTWREFGLIQEEIAKRAALQQARRMLEAPLASKAKKAISYDEKLTKSTAFVILQRSAG